LACPGATKTTLARNVNKEHMQMIHVHVKLTINTGSLKLDLDCFCGIDKLVMVGSRKKCDMAKVSEFCLEK